MRRCLGTGDAGSGTRARHVCSAKTETARTTAAAPGAGVAFDTTSVVPATDDGVRLDAAAQQLSACT